VAFVRRRRSGGSWSAGLHRAGRQGSGWRRGGARGRGATGPAQGGRGAIALGAVATGLLLLLSYPPFNRSWLAWFALVPLLLASQPATGRGAPLAALAAGAVWGGGIFYPLLFVEGGMPGERLLGFLLTTGAVSAFLASYAALYAVLVRRARLRRPGGTAALITVLGAAALWVALEYGMRTAAVGFSVYLGVTQWQTSWARSLAALGGIHAVSGMVVLANTAVARGVAVILHGWRPAQARPAGVGGWKAGAALAAIGAVSIALFAWPAWTTLRPGVEAIAGRDAIAAVEAGVAAGGGAGAEYTVVLVQPGITPAEYDRATSVDDQLGLLGRTVELTGRALRGLAGVDGTGDYEAPSSSGGTLVVWPETTLHVPLMEHGLLRLFVEVIVRRYGIHLLAGFPRAHWEVYPTPRPAPGAAAPAPDASGPTAGNAVGAGTAGGAEGPPGARDARERNAAYFFGPDGGVLAVYDKVNVIPIAEERYAAGDGVRVFPLPAAGAPAFLGVGICSDVVEPGHARALVRAGATSLHYIASLSRIGTLAGLERAFLSFRAAEHGVYVTQTATTGPTLVVGPSGDLVDALDGPGPGTLAVRIRERKGGTLYTRYGDWPAGAAGTILLLTGLWLLPGTAGGRKQVNANTKRIGRGRSGRPAWLMALAIAFVLSIAGSPAAQAAQASPRLVVWAGGAGTAALLEDPEGPVAGFEREVGVQVDVVATGWPDLLVQFLKVSPGQTPDVLLVPSEALPLLVREGLILPLDNSSWPEWDALYPQARESVVWNGRVYGAPAYASVRTFIYHEAPFIRYGVDRSALPQTWREYEEVVRKLTVVQGSRVEVAGAAPSWIEEWSTWLGALWQASGSLLDARGAAQFQGRPGAEALQYLAGLRRLVDIPGPAMHTLDIASGRVASAFADYRTLRTAKAFRPLHGGFLVAGSPIGRERTEVVAEFDVWVVSARAKDRALAERFVHWALRPEFASALAGALGELPVRRDGVPQVVGEADVVPFIEVLEKYSRPLPLLHHFGALAGLLQSAVLRAVLGEAEPSEALAEAAAAWNEIAISEAIRR